MVRPPVSLTYVATDCSTQVRKHIAGGSSIHMRSTCALYIILVPTMPFLVVVSVFLKLNKFHLQNYSN